MIKNEIFKTPSEWVKDGSVSFGDEIYTNYKALIYATTFNLDTDNLEVPKPSYIVQYNDISFAFVYEIDFQEFVNTIDRNNLDLENYEDLIFLLVDFPEIILEGEDI